MVKLLPCVVGAGTHERDNAHPLLHGHARQTEASCDADWQRRTGQDGHHQRQTVRARRGLRHLQRPVQLLHHVRDAAARPRKTAREESRTQLRSAWKQKAHLLHRRHEHAGGSQHRRVVCCSLVYRFFGHAFLSKNIMTD